MKKTTILLFLFSISNLFANNINVENVSLVEYNSTSNWVKVQFDLSWENSWRISSGPANYDAAWVFIKYRVNSGNWNHGIVSLANSSVPSGAEIEVTSDGIGAFIYRDADGNGNNNWDGIQIRWNVGSISDNDQVEVQVQAIEMVYVPQSSFYLGGSTGDESNKFHSGGFSTSSPFSVSSESALTIANTSGNLYYSADNANGGDQTGILASSWPKGYNPFYCMKYETTEGQWLAFFNFLTENQKLNRDVTDASHKNSDAVVSRNTISWTGGSSQATSSAPDRAMSYLSPADINAYMDWTGLRPMTELEYEKACRGPISKFPNDFAWGNANITNGPYALNNNSLSNETISNPATSTGNAIYSLSNGSIDGPLRAGIFAASALNNNREETGATYYGIMEMSGNLYERVITVGTTNGRNFTGLHGNGIISSTTGNGTVSNWPNNTTGDGYGFKGGSWLNGSDFLRVSDRFDGASIISSGNNRLGFRAVRTAP